MPKILRNSIKYGKLLTSKIPIFYYKQLTLTILSKKMFISGESDKLLIGTIKPQKSFKYKEIVECSILTFHTLFMGKLAKYQNMAIFVKK